MSDFLFSCPNQSRPLGRTKPAASRASRSLGNHLEVPVAAATKLQPRRSTSSAEGRRVSERSVLQRAPGEGIVAVKVKDRPETNFDLRCRDLRSVIFASVGRQCSGDRSCNLFRVSSGTAVVDGSARRPERARILIELLGVLDASISSSRFLIIGSICPVVGVEFKKIWISRGSSHGMSHVSSSASPVVWWALAAAKRQRPRQLRLGSGSCRQCVCTERSLYRVPK
jgi:hypothetical protein